MNLTISKEVLSEPDASPAYKVIDVKVVVDERLTYDEQVHAAMYEILSSWLDPLEQQREFVLSIANQLLDAVRFLREG